MKTKIYMIMGALLVTLLTSAQTPWTLQQCVDTALANNRNVKQQALTKQSKEIAYDQARKNLLPDLNASIGQNFGFGRTLDENYKYTNSTAITQNTNFNVSSSIL